MCWKCDNKEMAGLHEGHLSIALQYIPLSLHTVVKEVFSVITESLTPHLPVFAGLVAMLESLDNTNGKDGMMAKHGYPLVRMPLSIIGNDKVRYRTLTISLLHESILSFNMAELTVKNLQNALNGHGVGIVFLCSCGVVMGPTDQVSHFYGSDLHKRLDKVRSAIDAQGNPVKEVLSLDTIPPNMDISSGERALFARIEDLINVMSHAGHPDYPLLDKELQFFVGINNPALQSLENLVLV